MPLLLNNFRNITEAILIVSRDKSAYYWGRTERATVKGPAAKIQKGWKRRGAIFRSCNNLHSQLNVTAMGYDMKERALDEPWKVDNSTKKSANCHLLRVRGFNEIMLKLNDNATVSSVRLQVVAEPWQAN